MLDFICKSMRWSATVRRIKGSTLCIPGLSPVARPGPLAWSSAVIPTPSHSCLLHSPQTALPVTLTLPAVCASCASLLQKYGVQPAQPAFVTAPMTAPPPQQAMM